MIDRNIARGIFLSAIALGFGLQAIEYPIHDFANPGPGMFPLIVSALLLAIGIANLLSSRTSAKEPLDFNWRNIGLILASLCGLAVVSLIANMALGIISLVFISGFAASSYSIKRNVKISVGLLIVAFAFQKLLGLNLPLI